jgi:H+/Cl- antiporter ClcA
MGVAGYLKRKIKIRFDHISNQRIKNNLLQAVPFWIASLITGLVAVGYTRLFALAEKGTGFLLSQHLWWLFIIAPVSFFLAWWVVDRFSPYAKGSGIPQVMASIELATPKYTSKVDKLLNLRVVVIKILSSLLMVFGGGAIGREGPTIQIAGSIFRTVHKWLPAWWPKISKKNMIMTGAAAGLAAAFNTPLGGIVFAVEELTKTHINYFKTAIFTAVIIAGLTAQALLGPYLYLGYPDVSHLSKYIFLPLILVAVVSGFTGSLMAKCMMGILNWKKNFSKRWHHILYLLVCAFIVALLAYFVNISVTGSGKLLMTKVLFTDQKYSSVSTMLMRIVGPLLSFTTGAAGGVFAPSLSAGAGIGSMLSGWLHESSGNTDLLILASMVAFLTGVTRSPFTSAILVLEMTDRHNVIFHLMLAGMTASLIATVIDNHSLYDRLKVGYIHDIHHEDIDEKPPANGDDKP